MFSQQPPVLLQVRVLQLLLTWLWIRQTGCSERLQTKGAWDPRVKIQSFIAKGCFLLPKNPHPKILIPRCWDMKSRRCAADCHFVSLAHSEMPTFEQMKKDRYHSRSLGLETVTCQTHTHTKSVMFSRKSLGFLLKTCWSTFAKKTANKIWHTDRRMNLANRLPMRSQLAYPYAPCMEYLSIFTIYLSQMQVIIPYNWNCWKKRFPKT